MKRHTPVTLTISGPYRRSDQPGYWYGLSVGLTRTVFAFISGLVVGALIVAGVSRADGLTECRLDTNGDGIWGIPDLGYWTSRGINPTPIPFGHCRAEVAFEWTAATGPVASYRVTITDAINFEPIHPPVITSELVTPFLLFEYPQRIVVIVQARDAMGNEGPPSAPAFVDIAAPSAVPVIEVVP